MTSVPNQPVCIVTGGSFGIGQAVCEKFLAQGYQVVNLDIQSNTLLSPKIQWLECNVALVSQVEAAISKVAAQYGRVDALISNAGIHFSANIENTSEQDLDDIFAINVKGAYAAIRAVLPSMKNQKSGAILLMASDQALIAKHNSFAYNLSKAALASIAKTTALDYARYNIRANAVCPGTIETPLYHKAIDSYVARSGEDKAQVHAQEAALQPLGRLGQANEVAELCYFLAGDQATFITGSLQLIDGGYTTQ
ncbi:MAG: 2-keto-3-deoxy-L-fuconate dehydrogenase [Paraglaciecola sp.]|jgi:2-keto-3-deoxy-L-fuconate dehydrogenase